LEEKILKLFKESLRLKEERRKGWLIKAKIDKGESVADHTFQLTLMAMVLSKLLGLDQLKTMKLALLHDLPEALVGDATPEEYDREKRDKEEEEAFKKLFNSLDDEYLELWKEYKEQRSEEAKLVKELDSLEMCLQGIKYYEIYKKRELLDLIKSASKRIKREELRKFIKDFTLYL